MRAAIKFGIGICVALVLSVIFFIWLHHVPSVQASVISKPSSTPPNIIIFLADDLGWADTSFRGNPQIPTPNLDALASSGIILNNCYVLPTCTPSRGALMTGLYPIHTGLQHSNLLEAEPRGLSHNFTIIPEHLKDLGYTSHMVGKWNLGYFEESFTPTYRGFDSFYGYYNGGEDYYTHTFASDYNNETYVGLDFWNNTTPVLDQGGHYSTRLFTKRAVSLIEAHNKAKPFFLYMAHQAVHIGDYTVGLKAPASSVAHFPYIHDLNRSIHAGAVYELDESVGLVMESLKRKGMLENSVVAFSTDNGGLPWGADSNSGFNWPLRGGKATLWEGGVRGAAFVWSPLLSRVGRLSNQMMHITDWLPTLYSAAGWKIPSITKCHTEVLFSWEGTAAQNLEKGGDVSRLGDIDGKDMWEALSEDLPSPRHEILLNIDPVNNISGLIVDNRKVVLGTYLSGSFDGRAPVPGGTRPVEGLDRMMLNSRTGAVLRDFYDVRELAVRPNWRQEVAVNCSRRNAGRNFVAASPPYYFDIQRDPCELDNLASTNVTELEEMMQKLAAYAATMVPPANLPLDPRGLPKYHHGLWAPWL